MVAHDLDLLVRLDVPLHDVAVVVPRHDLLVEGAPHERGHLLHKFKSTLKNIIVTCLFSNQGLSNKFACTKIKSAVIYLGSLGRNWDGHNRLVSGEGPRVDHVDDAGVPHLLVRAERHHLARVRECAGPHRGLGVDAALHLAFEGE